MYGDFKLKVFNLLLLLLDDLFLVFELAQGGSLDLNGSLREGSRQCVDDRNFGAVGVVEVVDDVDVCELLRGIVDVIVVYVG